MGRDGESEQLQLVPTMPATVIAERVDLTRRVMGVHGSVAGLRPAHLPLDPAGRTDCVAGDTAQFELWVLGNAPEFREAAMPNEEIYW